MGVILDRPGVGDTDRKLRAELVGRAAELVPLLRANAARTEDGRRVAEENVTALAEAGLFRITQPRRFGGLEVDFRTRIEIVRELARGCGSTAWVTSLMTGGAWFIGMWNEQVQRDVWGEHPDARVAGVPAPLGTVEAVDGGYRVSGRWPNCSGCLHADWLFLGIPILGEGGRLLDQGLVLVPTAEVTVEDTWRVAGMRGTGSNTVVAHDVFVPGHRYLSQLRLLAGENDSPYPDEAIYQVPFAVAAISDLVGTQLGLARAALDLVIENAGRRGISATDYQVQTEAPTVQLAVAKAAVLLDMAELLAYRAAAEIDEAGQRNQFPGYLARARYRMDIAQAVVNAREAIRELLCAHGSASFNESHPLQRIWRDSEVASRHAGCNPAISAEVYGRALLGHTSGVTSFV
jgi:3-hydroxy-9,10-secoandrosta-1,3,5(10)-triene-9,17-dione monooxygenase